MASQIGLVIHFVALSLIAAGNIAMLLVTRQVWRKTREQSADAMTLVPLLRIAPKIILAGSTMIMLSGLNLLRIAHWIYLSQPVFIAKLVLYALLIIRALTIGRQTLKKLCDQVSAFAFAGGYDKEVFLKLKFKLNRFRVIQLVLLFIIIVISIINGPAMPLTLTK